VTKLFGYDYEIIYKKGKENVVVDAISKKYEDEGSLFSLTFIVIEWLQVVRQEWLQEPKIYILIQKLQQDAEVAPGYSWHNEEFLYKGRLYLSFNASFLLHYIHQALESCCQVTIVSCYMFKGSLSLSQPSIV
jgi:hypothetical protein